jgi:hypothetical protein
VESINDHPVPPTVQYFRSDFRLRYQVATSTKVRSLRAGSLCRIQSAALHVDSRAPPGTASSPPRGKDARQHESIRRYCVTETVCALLHLVFPCSHGRTAAVYEVQLHDLGVMIYRSICHGYRCSNCTPRSRMHSEVWGAVPELVSTVSGLTRLAWILCIRTCSQDTRSLMRPRVLSLHLFASFKATSSRTRALGHPHRLPVPWQTSSLRQ